MDKSKPLNERQERFCMLLAVPDHNGRPVSRADAYLMAYGVSSRRYACMHASKLMKDPRVRDRVSELSATVYGNFIDEHIPVALLMGRLRERIDDPSSPMLQLRAIKMAMDLREKYGRKDLPDENPKSMAMMNDAELMAEVRRQGLW